MNSLTSLSIWLFAFCLQRSSSGPVMIGMVEFGSTPAYTVDGNGISWKEGSNGSYETCGIGAYGDFLLVSNRVDLSGHMLADVIHVDVEAEFSLCFHESSDVDRPCYTNFFEVYVYGGSATLRFPRNNRAVTKREFLRNFSPVFNITNTTLKGRNERQRQTFTFFRNGLNSVTFGIRSRGACGKIHSVKLYYYFCRETFINSVKFANTSSPANGFREVNGNCSMNSLRSNVGGDVTGHCYSNSSWSINSTIKCSCIEGYEPSQKRGCSLCANGYFKQNISNKKCSLCPSNSISLPNRTGCECKNGFYSLSGHSSNPSPCYAPLKLHQKPAAEHINGGNVNITWIEPKTNGGLNKAIFYDVECYFCEGQNILCNKKCIDVEYNPRSHNLTQTFVLISNLLLDRNYVFRVYPKNSLNYVIEKQKWNYTEVKYQSIPTSTGEPAEPTASGFGISPIVSAIVTFFVLLIIGTSCLFGLWIWKRRRNGHANNTLSQLELDDPRPTERDQTPDYEITDFSNEANEPSEYEEIDVAIIPSSDNYYEFWEIPIDSIVMLTTLGHGSFGTVKKAWIKSIHGDTSASGKVVAVKLLKENATLKDKEDFMNELDIMKKLVRHRFVVQLLGCCTQSEPYHLILEYLPGGDLLGYLRKSRGHEDYYNTGELVPTSRFNETELMRFAWMISDAMVSLSSQGVVHRDLAARNVLVGEENICKVSDFGLAREGRYERKSKARLPVKWMAPEDLFHGLCTTRSDVWAYGILLWEIFTIGDSPYPRKKGPDVIGLIGSGYRMPKPAHCSDSLYAIMMNCWNENPDERPAFAEIRSFFKEHLQNNQVCLDLSKYDENEYLNFDVIN